MACADRTCSEIYNCILAIPGYTPGSVLGLNASGALTWATTVGGLGIGVLYTTTTVGMTIDNGLGQSIDYSLPTGIAALTPGVQGVLNGTGLANTYVGADGQLHLLPSSPSGTFISGDLTTTTPGMLIGNGVGSVNGAGTQVNYSLANGITALTTGIQGKLGGALNSDVYVGKDAQLHQLPSLQVDTTFIDNLTSGTTTAFPATYTRILYIARNGLVQRLGIDYTLGAGVVNWIVPFGISGGATSVENVLIANLT